MKRPPNAAQAPATATLTRAQLEALYPDHVQAWRADGADDERRRIRGVYEAASLVTLDPLICRLLWDGKTAPEAAALAMVAAAQAGIVLSEEAASRARSGPPFTIN